MKLNLKNIPKYLLIVLYPLFLSVLLEYNICQNFNDTLKFLMKKPNILLFNIIICAILFTIIFLVFKKAYLSMAIHGGIFYILSCIEYFKYKTSGSHLVISDLLMTKNLSDVGKFASLKITYPLILNFIILVVYILLTYKNNLTLDFSLKKRICSCAFISMLITIFLTTSISAKIFSVFEIETPAATNILESNEQFSDIGFLPYLAKTTSENLMDIVNPPENYSYDSIKNLISNNGVDNNTENTNKNTPNVVFIMSESFSDFRVFDSLNIDKDIYSGFDSVASEGYVGNCVVPTFGGYTTRTEFELLTGLPTYAINTPSVPQNLLKKQKVINTIPSYFKTLGYNTAYIHPFSKTFYDRDTLYTEYGFDNLYFDDSMTVETENFRRYISDKSVFNEIKSVLKSNKSPSYIFATTMQNHQPYYAETAEGEDQLSYYLAGVKETSDQLREFTNWLKDFDEDVILVFVGDHFPFFTPDDNVYDRLAVSDNNADLIYNQKYIMWNNYDSSIFDKNINTISAFYIPFVLIDLINSKKTDFIETMQRLMNEYPLYSPSIQSSNSRNESLDLITYDRVIGENYSSNIENNDNIK
ncbi:MULTISPECIES: alkaline phosphatase family protein [unclassified Clostridium]|uniref:LTA synthase family protein n=1 Tax=unclassified Clostridium TaxID=2614128 RepID=UPI001C8C2D86|nr:MULTISPECIES: alkaline phosphatase family protein [unclassified Clostridium]MBX9137932.1 sulfatase-like hydrolase/transferase [Clostridium sp. K12(2020)]MBX9144705.1 sulfatase-like hydrolase/transferase [Clostridium sp. K13]